MTRIGSLSLQAGNATLRLRGVSTLGELQQIFVESNDVSGREGIRPSFVVNRLNSLHGFRDVASVSEASQILLEPLNGSEIRRIRPCAIVGCHLSRGSSQPP